MEMKDKEFYKKVEREIDDFVIGDGKWQLLK